MDEDDGIYIENEVANVLRLIASSWKCDPVILERIGAMTLLWAGIDNALEIAIWDIEGIDVAGIKHDSVRAGSEDRIKMFGAAASRIGAEPWHKGAAAFCLMAQQVLDYRNAITHGVPDGTGFSVNNRPKRGEIRRKPPTEALLDARVLNGVIALLAVMIQFLVQFIEVSAAGGVEAATIDPDVRRQTRRMTRSRLYAEMAAQLAADASN